MAAIADPNPTHAGRETVAPFAGTALRSQAEAALRARRAAGLPSQNAASPEASQRALHELHELHVHQIELEMQNEELQRSQAELHAANRRYVDLYDQAPVGYFTVSEAGQILQTNRTASTMLGLARSALTQKAFTHFVVREDRDRYYLMCRALLKSGQAQSAELRLQRQDGTLFWAQLEANSAAHTSGAQQLRLVLSDISVRKALEAEREQGRANLEQEVKRRTQQYLDLYDQAPCGYHTLSAEGVVLRVNQTRGWRCWATPGTTLRATTWWIS